MNGSSVGGLVPGILTWQMTLSPTAWRLWIWCLLLQVVALRMAPLFQMISYSARGENDAFTSDLEDRGLPQVEYWNASQEWLFEGFRGQGTQLGLN